jgi:hypothetical protein
MNRHDIAVLTLRAFAIYAWFQALELFTTGTMTVIFSTTLSLRDGMTIGRAIGIFFPAPIFILVGVFLFMRSHELASWLLPSPSDVGAEQLPPHPLPAASVAFAVVGVAIFLNAIPRALAFGIFFAQISDPKELRPLFDRDSPQIIGLVVQIALSFVLFLKSRTFATVWWRKQQPQSTNEIA